LCVTPPDASASGEASGLFGSRAKLKGKNMIGAIVLIILILLLIGGLPFYPYSRRWGYAPGGILGLLVVLVLLLMYIGYMPRNAA
jgi:hypothetical protein